MAADESDFISDISVSNYILLTNVPIKNNEATSMNFCLFNDPLIRFTIVKDSQMILICYEIFNVNVLLIIVIIDIFNASLYLSISDVISFARAGSRP